MLRTVLAVVVVSAAACTFGNPIGAGHPKKPEPTPQNTDPLTTALPSEARRLTQGEIDRTLRDVLKEPSQAGTRLLDTDKFTPYDNDYTTQSSSSALVENVEAMSIDVAGKALANADSRAVIIPCTPTGNDDTACLAQVVRETGRRLLR